MGAERGRFGHTTEMAELIARQILAVRKLPGMARATAFVVTESNIILLAEEIAVALKTQRLVANFEILFLDRANQTRPREDGSGREESGFLNPGLRTSMKNKFQTAELVTRFLKKDRLYVHQEAACYSMRQESYEHNISKGQAAVSHAILWRQLYPGFNGTIPATITCAEDVFNFHQREINIRALYDQFLNISFRPKSKISDNGDRITKYSITGKVKDGDKDDMYMGFSIAFLGAVFYFQQAGM